MEMTAADFTKLINHPDTVEGQHASDLKILTERYPYFYQTRLLWLKSLQKSNSIHFESQVDLTAFYAADRRWLYFYLYPEKKLNQQANQQQRDPKFTGSYFDLLEVAESEGGDARLSLKKIAESLKASRALLAIESKEKSPPNEPIVLVPVIDYFKYDEQDDAVTLEDKSKQYIREKRYREAIEVLNQLNLINPKKSIYFADQIRYLEKIIAYSK
ncbi:MAG: hypothetical protein Q7J05_09630 [Paludibacter sp.]|nr:hypothetical protein [Paludibacter sp.]